MRRCYHRGLTVDAVSGAGAGDDAVPKDLAACRAQRAKLVSIEQAAEIG